MGAAPTIRFRTERGSGASAAGSERNSLRRAEPLMFRRVVARLAVDAPGLEETERDDVRGRTPGLGGRGPGPGVRLDSRLGMGEFVLEEIGLRSCHMVVSGLHVVTAAVIVMVKKRHTASFMPQCGLIRRNFVPGSGGSERQLVRDDKAAPRDCQKSSLRLRASLWLSVPPVLPSAALCPSADSPPTLNRPHLYHPLPFSPSSLLHCPLTMADDAQVRVHARCMRPSVMHCPSTKIVTPHVSPSERDHRLTASSMRATPSRAPTLVPRPRTRCSAPPCARTASW